MKVRTIEEKIQALAAYINISADSVYYDRHSRQIHVRVKGSTMEFGMNDDIWEQKIFPHVEMLDEIKPEDPFKDGEIGG